MIRPGPPQPQRRIGVIARINDIDIHCVGSEIERVSDPIDRCRARLIDIADIKPLSVEASINAFYGAQSSNH
ncbi:hypothetical protein D3C84_842370 [compost metagenome]